MGKFKASGGAAAADIEVEVGYATYDEATYGVPPKGPYRCRLRRLEATESKVKEDGSGGDPMLKGMLIIEEPPGTKKAKFNGYIMNLYRVATEEQAGTMNQFLQALAGGPGPKAAALIKSFWTNGATTDAEDVFITKIGVMKFDPEGPGIMIGVNTRNDTYNGEKRIAPGSYVGINEMPEPVLATEDDEDDEVEAEDGLEDSEAEDDEEVEARREELGALTRIKLKTVAKGAGGVLKDYKDLEEADLIEYIIELEYPLEDEPEEGDEEADPDEEKEERAEELEGLTLTELKKVAKSAGMKIADYKGLSQEELTEAVLALEFPDEEEDADDEEADDADAEDGEEKEAREEELSDLTLVKLKAVAKSLKIPLAEYRKLDEEELVALILSKEFPDSEDEDEPDEEEPPAKPARRGAKAAAPAKAAGRPARRGKSGDEPPF